MKKLKTFFRSFLTLNFFYSHRISFRFFIYKDIYIYILAASEGWRLVDLDGPRADCIGPYRRLSPSLSLLHSPPLSPSPFSCRTLVRHAVHALCS